jgi:hypothetical protein
VFRRREKQFLAKHSARKNWHKDALWNGIMDAIMFYAERLLQATARHQFRLKSGGAREDAGGRRSEGRGRTPKGGGRTLEGGCQKVEEGRRRDKIGGRSSPLPSAAAELSPV